MKRSLLLASILTVSLVFACKGRKEKTSDKVQDGQDSTATEIIHGSDNQEKTDSIKDAKTKEKFGK